MEWMFIMIKIRIENSNLSNYKESNTCEIIDNSLGPESNIHEYLTLFMRALLGLSFMEDQIKKAIILQADEFKEELNDKKTKKQNLLDMASMK